MLTKDAATEKLCELQQQKINGTMQPRERMNCETTKPSNKTNNRSQCPELNFSDVDCNFMDEMIDENVGISFLPAMVSPRDNHKLGVMHGHTESICSVLKSLDIIENEYHPKEQKPVERKKKVRVKLSSKNKENLNNKGVLPVTLSRSPLKLKQSVLNPNCRLLKNMSEHFVRKQKKIQNLKEQIEENEMKECTFKPHCNNQKSKEKVKTNLNQFLKKQQEHINKIQKKKQSIRKKNDEAKKAQESFKPKINKNYPQTNRSVNAKPAYERLYELNTTKLKNNAVQEQVHEFKPTRSPVQRQKNTLGKSKCGHGTSLFLYEDAERRQNIKKSIERSKENVQHLPKFVTKTSEIYLQKKFVKQYCYVLDCLGFLSAETQTEPMQPQKQTNLEQEVQDENFQEQDLLISKPQLKQKINIRHPSNAQTYRTNASYSTRNLNEEINRKFTPQEFIKILSKLGFLAYGPEDDCEINELAAKEKNLAFQAYQTLQQYEVNVRNVFIFLLAVLGIFETQGNDGFDTVNSSNNNQLRLTEKEGRRLHHYFDLLYRNRLSSSNTVIQKTDRSQPQNSSPCQSRTHISHTNTLAEKYRSKMIERANQTFISNNIDIVLPTENMLAHEDLLVIDSIGRNLQIKKLRQEKKSYVDDECTFHPKINESHGYARAHTDRGIQKCRQLYQYAKSKHELAKNQENIFNDDIEKSPNRDHQFLKCFHEEKSARGGKTARETKQERNNQTSKGESKRMNTCIDVKDVDKTVARMALARKEREMKKKLVERGEPDFRQKKKNLSSYSKINSSMIPSRSEPSVPCFGMHTPTALFTPTMLEPQEYHISEPGDDEPFLVIDINMGEEVDHIEFYVGDERRVGQIVDQFCTDHDLDDECKSQLLQLVEVEMAKYLNNIGDSTED